MKLLSRRTWIKPTFVIVPVLAVFSFAWAGADALAPGTYTTTIAAQDLPPSLPPEVVEILVGTWEIQLTETGAFYGLKGSAVVVFGKYVSNSKRLIIHDEGGSLACTAMGTQVGVYGWTRLGGQVILNQIQDRCGGRALVMTTHPLQMQE